MVITTNDWGSKAQKETGSDHGLLESENLPSRVIQWIKK